MTNLIHRSCSNCVYWSDAKIVDNNLIVGICEKSITTDGNHKIMKGSDKCGQWKKLKYRYDPMWDEMRKYYR